VPSEKIVSQYSFAQRAAHNQSTSTQIYSPRCCLNSTKITCPRSCHLGASNWVEQRGSAEVADNVRGALQAIDKNEEFIKMTLAVMMAPE
jgi:hypothetical protein